MKKLFSFLFFLSFALCAKERFFCFAEVYDLDENYTQFYDEVQYSVYYDIDLFYSDNSEYSNSTSSSLVLSDDYGIMPLSSYNTFYATLSEPYLTYLQSYASSRSLNEHYVAFITQDSKYVGTQNRTSTVYNIFISDDLEVSGSTFTGSGTLYRIFASTNYFDQFSVLTDSNFILNAGTALVYTDLTSDYPDIVSSTTTYPALLFYLLLSIVFSVFLLRLVHAKKTRK